MSQKGDLEMLEAGGECLVQSIFLRHDGQLKVLRDGIQLDDDVVFLVEGRHLRPNLAQEGQMVHKLLHRLGQMVQFTCRSL